MPLRSPAPLIALTLGLAIALLPWGGLAAVGGILLLLALWVGMVLRPWLGLALALLLGPWGALENIWLGGASPLGPLDSGQLMLLMATAAWLARGATNRRIVLPPTRLTLPLLAYCALILLTLLGAQSPLLGLIELSKWVQIWLMVVLVADWAHHTAEPRAVLVPLLAIVLLAGLSQALIGIWQFAPRGHGPEHFLVLGRFYRAYGTYEQPNPFGGYMALNATLALGTLIGLAAQFLTTKVVTTNKTPFRIPPSTFPILFTTAALTAALIMSWSRGAWLGFAAALGAMALFTPRQRPWLGLGLVGLALVALVGAWQLGLMPAAISERLATSAAEFQLGDVRGVDINDANYAVLERLAFWQAAVDMAQERPWLGIGFGNYALAYPDYALINWTTPLGHAHNYYLNLLAETGALGLLAYLVVWLYILWDNLRLLRRLPWPWRGVALGLFGAWVALSVHHLVDKLYVNNLYVHLGAMLGVQHLLGEEVMSG